MPYLTRPFVHSIGHTSVNMTMEFYNVSSISPPMIVELFWGLFHMKGEICVFVLSTEPFLTDLRVARYLVFSFAFLSNRSVYLKK